MDRILKKGKITVAMYYQDIPPFFMNDKEGNFQGFDVSLARDIARRLGVEVEFNRDPRTYDEVVRTIRERKADVAISMLSNTLGRARGVQFTQPYIVVKQALFINRLKIAAMKKGQSEPSLLIDQKGVRLGTMAGSSYMGFAKEGFPQATIVPYDDHKKAIEDVLSGDITAVLYDEVEVKRWYAENPERALYVQIDILQDKKDPFAFAVHWEDKHLLHWLNLYLDTIRIDGTYDALMDTYLPGEK